MESNSIGLVAKHNADGKSYDKVFKKKGVVFTASKKDNLSDERKAEKIFLGRK